VIGIRWIELEVLLDGHQLGGDGKAMSDPLTVQPLTRMKTACLADWGSHLKLQRTRDHYHRLALTVDFTPRLRLPRFMHQLLLDGFQSFLPQFPVPGPCLIGLLEPRFLLPLS